MCIISNKYKYLYFNMINDLRWTTLFFFFFLIISTTWKCSFAAFVHILINHLNTTMSWSCSNYSSICQRTQFLCVCYEESIWTMKVNELAFTHIENQNTRTNSVFTSFDSFDTCVLDIIPRTCQLFSKFDHTFVGYSDRTCT